MTDRGLLQDEGRACGHREEQAKSDASFHDVKEDTL
jgi:hypothetical protein